MFIIIIFLLIFTLHVDIIDINYQHVPPTPIKTQYFWSCRNLQMIVELHLHPVCFASVRDDELRSSSAQSVGCGAPFLTITFSEALITDLKSARSLWWRLHGLDSTEAESRVWGSNTLNHICTFPKRWAIGQHLQ